MTLNEISSKVIEAAIDVHKELGPGLLESVYLKCLVFELERKKLQLRSEIGLPVIYRGLKIPGEGYRVDLLVEDIIIVELKSVENIQPVHKKQLLTYLRLARKPLGLLINFNEELLVNGVTRVANGC